VRTIAAVVLVAACTSTPDTEPKLVIDPGPWFEHETQVVHVEWPGLTTCDSSGYVCSTDSPPSFHVVSAACDGCVLDGVDTSSTFSNAARFTLTATTTDAIDVGVVVESGGASYELHQSDVGDIELGVVAKCETVKTWLLDDPNTLVFHPCGATRSADETVFITPDIHTLRDSERFPFCADGSTCWPPYPRKVSEITAAPAADRWWYARSFIYTTPDAEIVTVRAPLDTGEFATATVGVPGVM
jgi:hypothetical protein